MAASRSPLSWSSAAVTAPWSCSSSFPLGRGRGQPCAGSGTPSGPPALGEGTSGSPRGIGRAHEAEMELQKRHVSPLVLALVPAPSLNRTSWGRDVSGPLCLPAPHVQTHKSPCKSEHDTHSRLPAGERETQSCFQMGPYCCLLGPVSI